MFLKDKKKWTYEIALRIRKIKRKKESIYLPDWDHKHVPGKNFS